MPQIPPRIASALHAYEAAAEIAERYNLSLERDFTAHVVPLARLHPRDHAHVEAWAARHHGAVPATVTRYRLHARHRQAELPL